MCISISSCLGTLCFIKRYILWGKGKLCLFGGAGECWDTDFWFLWMGTLCFVAWCTCGWRYGPVAQCLHWGAVYQNPARHSTWDNDILRYRMEQRWRLRETGLQICRRTFPCRIFRAQGNLCPLPGAPLWKRVACRCFSRWFLHHPQPWQQKIPFTVIVTL